MVTTITAITCHCRLSIVAVVGRYHSNKLYRRSGNTDYMSYVITAVNENYMHF